MYSNVLDLQNSLSSNTLIRLSNDTKNAVSADSAVCTAKIAEADALIDSMLGRVYTVPVLTTLTGTVSATTTAATGTGTKFLTELAFNDCILGSDGQIIVMLTATSNTAAVLAAAPSPAWASVTMRRIPAIVHYMSTTLAGYYLWQRRLSELPTPKDWQARYDAIVGSGGILETLSKEGSLLDNFTIPVSPQAAINTDNAVEVITFNDSTNHLWNF